MLFITLIIITPLFRHIIDISLFSPLRFCHDIYFHYAFRLRCFSPCHADASRATPDALR